MCPIEESAPIRPVNPKEQGLCRDGRFRCSKHVNFKPRIVNLLGIQVPLKNGWPPRPSRALDVPHRRWLSAVTLELPPKFLRVTRKEFKCTPCCGGGQIVNLMDTARTSGQKIRYPAAVNGPVSLCISKRGIERLTTLTSACSRETAETNIEQSDQRSRFGWEQAFVTIPTHPSRQRVAVNVSEIHGFLTRRVGQA